MTLEEKVQIELKKVIDKCWFHGDGWGREENRIRKELMEKTMEKILDIRNFDGSRRSEIWQNGSAWRILFFENDKLVHNVDVSDGLRKAEVLAEEFAYGRNGPQLLTEEGKESI